MLVSDNVIPAERLGVFIENLDKKGLNISKKWQKMYYVTHDEP